MCHKNWACICVCVLVLTCMSQTEGPEAQVGGCVGDAAKTVLYGMDGLVDSYVPKVKLSERQSG